MSNYQRDIEQLNFDDISIHTIYISIAISVLPLLCYIMRYHPISDSFFSTNTSY